eukprot:CAMPEP_0179163802 /NCGR_PEP_ID=MMETSP0796-20121207/80338_1 /TAXON_ID=73915 /ORGANISM="Pyrodinium bahamense, Strain pbaha01" /LENGTH=209 /DNA_ID=CAMNT_0020866165 /DNA_START=131 /DNA_END=757 /DNA_ORIENTATION=-
MQRGGLLHAFLGEVCDEQGHAWVELTPLMKWRLHITAEQASHVYTLIDGTDWGAGMLLEELPVDQWPCPDLAEASGIRWTVLDEHSFRPRDSRGRVNPDAAKDKFLCHWDPDPHRDAALSKRSRSTALGKWPRYQAKVNTRVGACCMLKGALLLAAVPPQNRFHCLYLFFDDPNDPAIQPAMDVAATGAAAKSGAHQEVLTSMVVAAKV